MRRHSSILVLTAALALCAGAAQAQDRAQDPRPDMQAMHARFQAMHEARLRQRADDLRTILRLRPDQEAALQAFLGAGKPPQPPMAGQRPAAPPPQAAPLTTPQRLDEMARREAEHAQRRDRALAALKAFYAALDPNQQKVFDALQRLEGPPGGFGGHGPGAWGPHGGPPGPKE